MDKFVGERFEPGPKFSTKSESDDRNRGVIVECQII